MPHATPTSAVFATGTRASQESLLTSKVDAAVHAASGAGVTEMTSVQVPTGLPVEPVAAESPSEVAMVSALSPTGPTASTVTGLPRRFVSELIASPDSPESRLEAFRTVCHPDRKFGVSIGIQCSSPDPHFVDLRVPRTSDNFQFQLPPFGKRNEPTFENPCPVKVDRGWQSARSLGNMIFKKLEIFVQNAQVVRMPRDGSCLYHALIQHTNYVTGANLSILQLRRELVDFVLQHKDLVVHGQPLQQWIKWECQCR